MMLRWHSNIHIEKQLNMLNEKFKLKSARPVFKISLKYLHFRFIKTFVIFQYIKITSL